MGVGGPARFLAEVGSVDELGEALEWARRESLGTFVLGSGSNLVVSDRGLDALVIQLAMQQRVALDRADFVEVRVGAGSAWDALVAWSVGEGLAGLECLSGIPGTVGATPIQNVGAYGQEVADTITEVVVIERATGERSVLPAAACRFGYRDSIFKHELQGRFVVVEVVFQLARSGKPTVRYPELARAISSPSPSLAEVRATVLSLRRGKSMVLDPADENGKSAGSFFVNPIVDADQVAAIEERVRAIGRVTASETMPAFAAAPGKTKLSAAWLIERSGLSRGTARGAVGLSTKHCLAVVNRGEASARDVVDFARFVRDHVAERTGVALRPEPELVGFEPDELAGLVVT
jgi:UDP-N-acetylmuramate dehydrogenase